MEYVVRDLEGDNAEDAIKTRERLIRKKIKNVIPCDVTQPQFFGEEFQTCQYDIVQTSLCLECALESREAYRQAIVKLASYVKPGGFLQILSSVGATWYTCSDRKIYALDLSEEDAPEAIKLAG